MLSKIKNSLEKSHYCPLSQKILIQAVTTPDGKVFDMQAIFKGLDENPKKYTFTKKDLKPNFKKIHQVYENIIKSMEVYIKGEGLSSSLSPERLERLNVNFLVLKELFKQGKLRSYDEVQRFCTQEQDEYLKKNRHLRLLYEEGKLSKEAYELYQKYTKLKSEIKEEYHYNLALKN